MRKMLLLATGILLAISLCLSTALAADVTALVPEPEGEGWRNVNASAVVGDTLYMLGRSSVDDKTQFELWQWKESMPQAELIAGNVFQATSYANMQEVEDYAARRNEKDGASLDAQYALSALASDGQRLIGVNGYNGKVFAITAADGAATFEDIATMSDTSALYHTEEDYSYQVSIGQSAYADGKLFLLAEDYDSNTGMPKNRLVSVDLATGESKTIDMPFAQKMASYKDGKLLLICRDEQNAWDQETESYIPADIMIYDAATGTSEKAAQMPCDAVRYVTYSEKLDALLYDEDCRIMAMVGLGEAKQVGYMPATWWSEVALVGDSYVSPNAGIARSISLDYDADVYLNVYGSYMDEGTMAFTAEHPQVPVYPVDGYYETMEQISQAMVSGDTALDVLHMETKYSNFFRLMDKGYCADLSGYPELMAYAERLHPLFRDAVMKDGKLYAIPLQAYSYDGWYVANGVMEEMGLTIEDVPTNFIELCEFATRWNDEWVEEYPQFALMSYVQNTKDVIFRYMMEAYVNWFALENKDLRFDTPEFRAMMEALEAMRVEDLEKGVARENEDEVGYRQGLMMPGYTLVGDFNNITSPYTTFVPMSIGEGKPFSTSVQLQVAFINPRCKNMEEAVELLTCKTEAIEEQDYNSYVLLTDKTEPVPNPYYEKNIKNIEESIAAMEERLAELPEEEKKDYQLMIDQEKVWLEEYKERDRWDISEEGIRAYREDVLPNAVIGKPDAIISGSSAEMESLIQRYLAGQIKLDQFIREADNKLMMMQLEDQ